MKNTILLFLALTACASAQPFNVPHYHRATAVAATPPTDSLKLRLVASSITGKSSGDTTYIWPATVGPTAYQLAASSKPRWYADSLNGKPAVRFDGSDDLFVTGGNVETWSYAVTVVMVAKASKPDAIIVYHENALSGERFYTTSYWPELGGANGQLRFVSTGSANNAAYSANAAGIAPFYWVAYDDRTLATNEITVDLNRAAATVYAANNNSTARHAANPMTIGGRAGPQFVLDGLIAEVLIYSKILTAQERTQLDAYISATYGL